MQASQKIFGAVIQARMSSDRLPGKVLLEIGGRPLIDHVYKAVTAVVEPRFVVVATSVEPSDDEFARHCERRNFQVYRGDLDNVFKRIQGAISALPIDAFFRVCADSPFYSPALMRRAAALYGAEEIDVVTNVHPRSFPKGLSVELCRKDLFQSVDSGTLTAEQREHVFSYFYSNSEKYRIRNFSLSPPRAEMSFCVDTKDDWARAEKMSKSAPAAALCDYSLSELLELWRLGV